MIIRSGSLELYPYAAFLVIREALADRETNKGSKLTKAVLNFFRKESIGHANDKLCGKAAGKAIEIINASLPPLRALFIQYLNKYRDYPLSRYPRSSFRHYIVQ